jgi:hypothetical protein
MTPEEILEELILEELIVEYLVVKAWLKENIILDYDFTQHELVVKKISAKIEEITPKMKNDMIKKILDNTNYFFQQLHYAIETKERLGYASIITMLEPLIPRIKSTGFPIPYKILQYEKNQKSKNIKN